MKLQLVLQWPSASLIDLDDIVQAEDRLIDNYLQDRDLHRLQHKYDDFGRANAERPLP